MGLECGDPSPQLNVTPVISDALMGVPSSDAENVQVATRPVLTPQLTKTNIGGAVNTVTALDLDATRPSPSLTVSVTMYVVENENTCVAAMLLVEVDDPSPQSQVA